MSAKIPFSIVAKPNGAGCNLDCDYCFFLSKELLHDTKRQEMSPEALRTYVQRYLSASPDEEVTMLWQGGEPTLRGVDFFRDLVALCEEYRRPTQSVTHGIQTNATLIDDEWTQFLAENDFLVGVSIDGPAQFHDQYRKNRGGRDTYTQVRRGWDRLVAAGVRTNVLCTVNAANQDHPLEVYQHFRDELGARFIQFIPIVERVSADTAQAIEGGWSAQKKAGTLYRQAGHQVTSRTVDPQKYGAFLGAVFEQWVRADVGRVFVQDFDSALSAVFGTHPTCVHAPECGNNLAINFNADVYTCDHWVEPDWFVGNLLESPINELLASPTLAEFSKKKRAQLPQTCLECPVRVLCNGGCPKDRFVEGASGPDQNYLCPGYFQFFTQIAPDLKAMATLINHGRAPSDIMDPSIRAQLRPNLPTLKAPE